LFNIFLNNYHASFSLISAPYKEFFKNLDEIFVKKIKKLKNNLANSRNEEEEEENLGREGARGGEFVANEIAGGDVRNGKEVGEATGVGAFADAGTAEEHPLHAPLAQVVSPRTAAEGGGRLRRRVDLRGGEGSREQRGGALGEAEAGYGRHGICRSEGITNDTVSD